MRALANSSSQTPLVGSTPNMAQGLAQAAAAAARPNFNLQFNLLQNSIIDRLNQKITEVQNSMSTTIDPQIQVERQRLVSVANDIDPLRQSMLSNTYAMNALGDAVGRLNTAVTAAAAGDPSEFNSILDGINQLGNNLQLTDGSAIGLYVSDGTELLKRDGVVRVTNPDGTTTKATSYSDFASQTDALSAITDAINRVGVVQTSLQTRSDALVSIMSQTQVGIDKIDTQIAAQQTLDQATAAGEIAKLKQQYSYMLQALSLSFEGAQSMADALTQRLSLTPASQPGSVVSLFT
ncbi:MAG: hypothetical protein ACM31L_19660 [Actinomycetota bacterium]